jgi:hypothetical protein
VVDQGNQQLAAQGGEKIDLEQPAAQGYRDLADEIINNKLYAKL